jgi:hypothetical protein
MSAMSGADTSRNLVISQLTNLLLNGPLRFAQLLCQLRDGDSQVFANQTKDCVSRFPRTFPRTFFTYHVRINQLTTNGRHEAIADTEFGFRQPCFAAPTNHVAGAGTHAFCDCSPNGGSLHPRMANSSRVSPQACLLHRRRLPPTRSAISRRPQPALQPHCRQQFDETQAPHASAACGEPGCSHTQKVPRRVLTSKPLKMQAIKPVFPHGTPNVAGMHPLRGCPGTYSPYVPAVRLRFW